MTLNICYTGDAIRQISVGGNLEDKEEVQQLIEAMNVYRRNPVEVTFLDANMVPADVADTLYKLQKHGECKVYALKRYLHTYLNNLGIKCRYVAAKFIQNHKDMKSVNVSGGEENPNKVRAFLEDIYQSYGYDYTKYQIESIMRRIKISMLRENVSSFDAFRDIVLRDGNIFEQVFLDFSINTTEFFRDPHVFSIISSKILPYLDSYSHIKIWCAGCSNGKEPYSLAILLHEAGMLHKTHIYATDINPYIIEEAKNGLYSLDTIDKDVSNYRKASGSRSFTDYFILKEKYMEVDNMLRHNILFFPHSLTSSGILNEFQLILCRNVLIYFNPKLQNSILETFHNSLDISGFLVLGKSEGMMANSGLDYFRGYMDKDKIYKRKYGLITSYK